MDATIFDASGDTAVAYEDLYKCVVPSQLHHGCSVTERFHGDSSKGRAEWCEAARDDVYETGRAVKFKQCFAAPVPPGSSCELRTYRWHAVFPPLA